MTAELFRSKDEEIDWLRKRARELECRINDLEIEIANRERIAEFEAVAIMRALKITMARARILRLLASGHPYNRERLLDEYAPDSDRDIRNVDSQMKRIRQAVGCIEIKSVYGYGYQLTPESVVVLRDIIENAKKERDGDGMTASNGGH